MRHCERSAAILLYIMANWGLFRHGVPRNNMNVG